MAGNWAPGERAEICRVICMTTATCVLAILRVIPPESVLVALGAPALPGLVGMVRRHRRLPPPANDGEKPR